jgi:hypothetical protein
MDTRRVRLSVGLALILVLAFALPAWAQKTDVIVLRNNDRLTGEIKRLGRNLLTLSTDDLSTVKIEWDKVVSITSPTVFDVVTRDGRRLIGSLGPPSAGQTGVGIVMAGGGVLTVPVLDVVSLVPIGSTFWRKLDGSADLGASYSKSSGVGQASFDGAVTYRRPSFETSAKFSTLVSREPDAPDSAQYNLNVSYSRFLKNRWYTRPFLFVEHNPDLGFNLRTTGAMAVGRTVKQSSRVRVDLGTGLAAGRELPADGSEGITNFDAVLMAAASFYTYDAPTTSLDMALMTFPSLNDAGRVRLNANTKLRRELLKDTYLTLTWYDSYDSRPPQASASKNDVGFTLSLGWTF